MANLRVITTHDYLRHPRVAVPDRLSIARYLSAETMDDRIAYIFSIPVRDPAYTLKSILSARR